MIDPISLPGYAELVRNRAYALWETEGCPSGRDAEHWRLCEEAIRADLAATAAAPAKPAKKAKAPARRKAPVPLVSAEMLMAATG